MLIGPRSHGNRALFLEQQPIGFHGLIDSPLRHRPLTVPA
jgi:hypothetical protein